MPRRTRNLILVAGVILVVGVYAVLGTGPSRQVGTKGPPLTSPLTTAQEQSPSFTTGPSEPETESDTRTYALALTDIPGLSGRTPAGSHIDVWVTWDRPVTRRPKVQPLLRDVTIERIVTPLSEGDSPDVLIRVPTKQLVRLVYGDRYGALNAALVP